MERLIKTGKGWRIGWNPSAVEFKGLVGTDDWAVELTEAEMDDFCRLLKQLDETMGQMASELMDEEKIAVEAESDLVWMQVEGYPQSYELRFILNSGRCVEGQWHESAIPGLLQNIEILKVF
jgi:hypothetical protein